MAHSDSKPKGMKKKSLGSVRARAGLPAKAGRRRPQHLKKVKERDGKQHWVEDHNGLLTQALARAGHEPVDGRSALMNRRAGRNEK